MPVRPELLSSLFSRQPIHVLQHGTVVRLFTRTGEHIAADNVKVARYGA